MEVVDFKRTQEEQRPSALKKYFKDNLFLWIYWFVLVVRLIIKWITGGSVVADALLIVMVILGLGLVIQLAFRMNKIKKEWNEALK